MHCIVSRSQVPPSPLQRPIEILNPDLVPQLGIPGTTVRVVWKLGPIDPIILAERGHNGGTRAQLGQLARGIFGYRWSSRSEAVAVAMLGGNPFSKQ